MTIDELRRWLKKKFFSRRPTGLNCARCGSPLSSREFCRECGASEDSGWGADYVGEESEDDFDYDDYLRREFGQDRRGKSVANNGTWIVVLFIVLIAGMLMMQFGTVRF